MERIDISNIGGASRGQRPVPHGLAALALVAVLVFDGCIPTAVKTTRLDSAGVREYYRVAAIAKQDAAEIEATCSNAAVQVRAYTYRTCENQKRQIVHVKEIEVSRPDDRYSAVYVATTAILGAAFVAGGVLILRDAHKNPVDQPAKPASCSGFSSDTAQSDLPTECQNVTTVAQAQFLGGFLIVLGQLGLWPLGHKMLEPFYDSETLTGERDENNLIGREQTKCPPAANGRVAMSISWPDGKRRADGKRMELMLDHGELDVKLPAAEVMERWSEDGKIEIRIGEGSATIAVSDCPGAVKAIEAGAKKAREKAAAAEREELEAQARQRAENVARQDAQQAETATVSVRPESTWMDVWDPRRGEVVQAWMEDDGRWIVQTADGNIWISADGGLTWARKAPSSQGTLRFAIDVNATRAPARISVVDQVVSVVRGNNVLLRANLPEDAKKSRIIDADFLESGSRRHVAVVAGREMYAANSDDPSVWRNFTFPVADATPAAIWIRGNGQIWIAITTDGRVLRSTDGGAHFGAVDGLPQAFVEPVVHTAGAEGRAIDMIAVTSAGAVFSTSDLGAHWTALGARLDPAFGRPIAIAWHPQQRGTFGVLTPGGLFYTHNRGASFQSVRAPNGQRWSDARGLRWMGRTAVVWGGQQMGMVRLTAVEERATFRDAAAGEDSGAVFFKLGSAELNPEAAKLLEPVVARLRQNPAFVIRVEGHTDASGARDANYTLSTARADAVQRLLIVQFKVEPNRISTAGFGPDRPVEPAGDKGRSSRNRRVEVMVVSP